MLPTWKKIKKKRVDDCIKDTEIVQPGASNEVALKSKVDKNGSARAKAVRELNKEIARENDPKQISLFK